MERAFRRDEIVVLYLVFQEIVKLFKDLVIQIPAEIPVAVGVEIEDVLAVFAAHSVEVVSDDVACQSERIQVGDEFAFILQRE